jgi:hypothetical protein
MPGTHVAGRAVEPIRYDHRIDAKFHEQVVQFTRGELRIERYSNPMARGCDDRDGKLKAIGQYDCHPCRGCYAVGTKARAKRCDLRP